MSTSWFGRQSDGATHESQLWRGRRAVFSRILQGFEQHLRTLVLALLLVAFLVLLYMLWQFLIQRQELTPMVTLQAGQYRWPMPPNAWAAEDIEGLSYLDGETISIVKQSGVAQTKTDVLSLLGQATIPERDANTAVIYYISMHGAFEGKTPYLIPPSPFDSPHDPSTWVQLSDVLQKINEVTPDRNKLVVLDCSRMRTNWHVGLAYNDFSQHLDQWWSENQSQFSRIAILNSTSPGERGWSSVFGHYFRLGLAGEADTTANDDDEVSVSELHQYLQARVSAWVQQNRGVTQLPMLLAAEDDFRVTWSSNARVVADLNKEDITIFRDEASVSRADRDDLWRQLTIARQFAPYCGEPLAWRNLEHELIWLEQLADSGQAYAPLATRTETSLRSTFEEIRTRRNRAEQSRSVRDWCSIVSGDNLPIPEDLKVHSLHLAEYFQTLAPNLSATLNDIVSQFNSQPSEQSLDDALWQMEQIRAGDLVQQQFLHMLKRYQFPGLWQRSTLLQQLLQLRDRAERIAIPGSFDGGDERTHVWVRPHLSAADDLRRHAEDQLLIDGPTQLDDYLQQAGSAYSNAETVARELTDAIRVRDQACAEIPYLAQWLTHPLRAKETCESDDTQVQDVVVPTVLETKRLGELIANHEPLARAGEESVRQAIEEIVSAANAIGPKLRALRAGFLAECRQFSDPTSSNGFSDAAIIRRIEVALQSPLLPSEMRDDLRKRHGKLVTRLTDRFASGADRIATSESASAAANSTAEANRPARLLPLLLLDFAQPDTTVSPNDLAALDESTARAKWRTGIQLFLQDLDNLSTRYTELDASSELAESEVRSEWSAMERRLRAVAPIWFPAPTRTAKNPVHLVRQLDLATLLLWHGDRSLRDFWGGAGHTTPFFATATGNYIRGAEDFLPAFRSSTAAALDTQLTRHRRAAKDLLKTSATDVVLLEPEDEVRTQIAVEFPSGETSGLPEGTAALLLRHEENRSAGARFDSGGAVPLPGGASDVTMTISSDGPRHSDSTMRVDAVFRGHEFPGFFQVQNLGGVTVRHQPYRYEQSQVTVHSPWKTLSIVFVLDCSSSMGTAMDDDGSRLEVAKEALRQLLSNLPARRSVRVGVRFFGHRLGWSTDRPVRILTSPTYARDIPNNAYPDGDVERVLPLTTLDDAVTQRLFQEMDGVTPWGQSPLYLSLAQSLSDDFPLEDETTDRHIVVLTDGRNYQFRPTPEDEKRLEHVIQAGETRPIPIHVLGLGMDDEEQREAAADFSTIADTTGGIYRNCDSSTNLMEALRSILEPESYSLEEIGTDVAERRPLGIPVYVETSSEEARQYAVNFRANREEIWLEGGEVLPFYVLPDGLGIYAYAYDHDVARTVPLVGTDRPPVVRLQKPIRTNSQVRFPISLQRQHLRESGTEEDRWRWTRRPVEAWVEITPLLPTKEAAGSTYVFYDANYEPHKPVPELQLVASDWPAEANAAQIQLWFKAQQTRPVIATSLASVVENGVGAASLSSFAPGIAIQIDAGRVDHQPGMYRLRVVERHDSTAPSGIAALKVFPPSGAGVKPVRIVRQFDARHGLVVHSFYYEQADSELLDRLSRSEIAFAPRTEAHRDAWRPDAPTIVIPVSETGNFIPLVTR